MRDTNITINDDVLKIEPRITVPVTDQPKRNLFVGAAPYQTDRTNSANLK